LGLIADGANSISTLPDVVEADEEAAAVLCVENF
jgi:hypothetical protein